MKLLLYVEIDNEDKLLCGKACPFLGANEWVDDWASHKHFCMLSREPLSVTVNRFMDDTYQTLRTDLCKRFK